MAERIDLIPVSDLPPIDPRADEAILQQLDPVVVPLVNRHINPKRFYNDPEYADSELTVTKYMGDNADQWVPALYIPYSAGENFAKDYHWSDEESPLYEAAQSAIILGLLTEDALPWYSEAIVRKFGVSEALRFFANVWTAEEGRHSKFLEGYVTVGRMVDPVQLEADRMANVIQAQVPDPPSAMESLVYVTIQELATRISHQNTAKLIADTIEADEKVAPLCEDGTELANIEPVAVHRMDPEERAAYLRQVIRAGMGRIVGDEGKHHLFYRDTVGNGALQIDPSTTVKAIEKQFRLFDMPGTGIRDFTMHAIRAANAGIYDIRMYRDEALATPLKHWDIANLQGLDPEAEQARERIFAHMDILDAKASKFEEQRDAERAKLMDDPTAIWVGKKV